MGTPYRLIQHEDAVEFVEDLSPTKKRFRRGTWIFRGQSRDLPLVPSAYREDRMPKKKRLWSEWTNHTQAKEELRLVRTFFETADRAGLPIPEDSYDIRQLLLTLDGDRNRLVKKWPPGRLWALIALAQHHGTPTRLLDWTMSPWPAAYFACEPILRRTPAERADCIIVVWAFNLDFNDDEEIPAAARAANTGLVKLVTTPYAHNRNLAAQRGVHLLYEPLEPLDSSASAWREPFDKALQHIYTAGREEGHALYKFELPASEAGRVLRWISKHGTTGATLFPGFDGVVKAMWERENWGPR